MLHFYKTLIINFLKRIILPLHICLQTTWAVALPTPIDDTVVLKIGPLDVSQYVVEKRYNRFQKHLATEAEIASNEVSSWFEDFLVNQVVTAKAISEGYTTHPDAVALVERMERHMLASVNGPYYQEVILKDATRSEDEVRKLYQEDSAGKEKMPFAEYFQMVQHRDVERTVQQHRAGILEQVQFSLNQTNFNRLLERLIGLPPIPANIPVDLLEDEGDLLLASYSNGGISHSVKAKEWIGYFNLLFVRSIPTKDITLKNSIEDKVITEMDIEAARASGLDKELQFVEDRKHFLNAQALEWFERERLKPEISISEEAVAAFYQEHKEAFFRPVAARGMLFNFKEKEPAIQWMRAYQLNERNDQLASSIEEVEVTQAHPIASLENLTPMILRMGEEELIGPIATEDGLLVFLKQASVTEPISAEEMSDYIIETLTRERLHRLEKELAPEYCKGFEIMDNIAYEKFGAKTVNTPWSD